MNIKQKTLGVLALFTSGNNFVGRGTEIPPRLVSGWPTWLSPPPWLAPGGGGGVIRAVQSRLILHFAAAKVNWMFVQTSKLCCKNRLNTVRSYAGNNTFSCLWLSNVFFTHLLFLTWFFYSFWMFMDNYFEILFQFFIHFKCKVIFYQFFNWK